jgi:hypothetical protein
MAGFITIELVGTIINETAQAKERFDELKNQVKCAGALRHVLDDLQYRLEIIEQTYRTTLRPSTQTGTRCACPIVR